MKIIHSRGHGIKPQRVVDVEVGDRVVLQMDNGEQYEIEEVRPSASQCKLELRAISGRAALSIEPIVSNRVIIGRAQ